MTYVTIDGFESLTAQEVFDISAKHLLKQGQKSSPPNEEDTCLYRGPNGLQCAAGPFIKDEYAEQCEGLGWYSLEERGSVPDTHVDLVCRLQNIHDGQPASDWKPSLELAAAAFGLKFSP